MHLPFHSITHGKSKGLLNPGDSYIKNKWTLRSSKQIAPNLLWIGGVSGRIVAHRSAQNILALVTTALKTRSTDGWLLSISTNPSFIHRDEDKNHNSKTSARSYWNCIWSCDGNSSGRQITVLSPWNNITVERRSAHSWQVDLYDRNHMKGFDLGRGLIDIYGYDWTQAHHKPDMRKVHCAMNGKDSRNLNPGAFPRKRKNPSRSN